MARILLSFICLTVLFSGCTGEEFGTANTPSLPADHWFPLKIGGKEFRVQLAIEEKEMIRGLMHRKELAADDGMIFIYPRPRRMSFWMHNTPLPLDIGFFDGSGTLREVYQLYPYDETPVPSRRSDIQFALEMNQGWFSTNEVRPGAQIDLGLLRSAVEARGFDPGAFGLTE